MQKKHSTARRRSPNLPKQYRDATHTVYMALDYTLKGQGDPMERYMIDLYDHMIGAAKARITVMCKLAGIPRTNNQSKDFEAAIRAALRRQLEENFDPARVLRLADNLARAIEIHGKVRGEQATPTKPKPAPTESHQDKTRRELLENCPRWGREYGAEVYDRLKLSSTTQSRDYLARYNIRKGDRVIVLLDGDVEHGELAFISYYDPDDRQRYYYVAFLVVEGEHFCIRSESHLECDDNHAAPEELTIIGRVVAVERECLPVKLKGLELRGLPYAEDPPPVKDEDED